jgi:hypothetical protein
LQDQVGENYGEESSDSKDNGFETTMFVTKGACKPHNYLFVGQKQKDNRCYETYNL